MGGHFLYYLLGNGFIQGINFMVLPIIGRHFSPAEYAVVPLLEIYLMVFSWLTSMMLLSGLDRYYFDDKYNRKEVLNCIFTFQLGASLTAFAVITAAVWYIEALAHYRYLVIIASLQQALLQVYLLPMETLKLNKKPARFLGYSLAKTAIYIAVFAAFVLGLKRDITAIYEAQTVTLLLMLAVIARSMPDLGNLRLRIDTALLKKLLSFSAPLILAGLGMYTIESSARFFILHYIGSEALGNFSFIYKIVNALTVLMLMPATSVWTPYVFSNLKNESLIKRSMADAFLLMTSAGLIIVLTLLANYYQIVELLSNGKFFIPIEVFGMLSTSYVFYCLLSVLAPGFHIREKPRLLVGYFLLGGAANILFNLLFIPAWQLFGAAAATFCSFLLVFLLYCLNLQRIFAITYAWQPLAIIWGSFAAFSLLIVSGNHSGSDNVFVLLFLAIVGINLGSAWLPSKARPLITHFFNAYNMYSRRLSQAMNEPHTDYIYKVLGRDDIVLLKDFARHRGPDYEEKALKMLANENGFSGLAFIESGTGKIVYLCWVAFAVVEIKEIGKFHKCEKDMAYFLDDFTLPEYRRRNLHSAMMARRLNYCYGRGVRKVHIVIQIFNQYAIRTALNAGFRQERLFVNYRSGALRVALAKFQGRLQLNRGRGG